MPARVGLRADNGATGVRAGVRGWLVRGLAPPLSGLGQPVAPVNEAIDYMLV